MQDIYSEPKILRKNRKKTDEKNETKEPDSVKNLVDKITHNQIKDLDFNLDNKVLNKHLNLQEPSENQKMKNSEQFKENLKREKRKSNSELRRENYLELNQLIQLEQKSYKYEDFVQLNSLWVSYMYELLEINQNQPTNSTKSSSLVSNKSNLNRIISNPSIVQVKLTKADFHGAMVSVKRSKNPSLVGLSGLIFQETEQCFKIIQKDDKIKMIPKIHTIFEVSIPIEDQSQIKINENEEIEVKDGTNSKNLKSKKIFLSFEINGNCFRFKSIDRVNKKFKFKPNSDL